MHRKRKATREQMRWKGSEAGDTTPEEDLAARLAEDSEIVSAVGASLRDIDAGRTLSFEEAFAEPQAPNE